MTEINPSHILYESMGTSWHITIEDPLTEDARIDLEKELITLSEAFNALYSRFVSSSLVSAMATRAGVFEVPPDFMRMLEIYQVLYVPSQKKLNPLVGFSLSDLGYDSTYSLKEKETVRSTPDLFSTIKVIDSTHVELREPVLIDFGALGKGYFVDRIAEHLTKKGFTDFLVNGSGDLFYKSDTPLRVGLEDPHDFSKVIGVATLTSGGLCGSAGSRRAWNGHHHIIDPYTGESPREVVATWVMAPTTALADALATCLFFVAPEDIPSLHAFEYCILNKERRVKHSPNFPVEFF